MDVANSTKATERPEIDGLRAFAILPVVLFHAGLGCPGGYAGVDVFFVVSGFLIGGIILRELDSGAFSFAQFWERRTRRILPAFLGLFAILLLIGWVLLPPLDLLGLCDQITAALVGIANFKMLALTGGYWARPADSLLLLHAWSLAVEEQFYVLMPVLLVMARRWGSRGPLLTMLVLFTVSLSLSLFWSASRYDGNFFLLPSRAWELLLGALGAWSLQQGMGLSRRARSWATWLGLLMIVGAVFWLGPDAGWPDAKTLLPTIGTFLILISPDTEAKPAMIIRMLSLPPLQFIGLISYSLYLWHWPLIVLVKNYAPDELSAFNRWQLVTASAALAAASWWLVEQPFRNRSHWVRIRTQPFVIGTIGVWLCLMAATQVVAKSTGLNGGTALVPESLQQPRALRNYDVSEFQLQHGGMQFNAREQTPRCLLLGSSHAMAIAPAVEDLSGKYHIPCALFCQNGFTPLFADSNYMKVPDRRQLRRDAFIRSYVTQWKPDVVIIAHRWGAGPDSTNGYVFESAFSNTVQWLLPRVRHVVVLSQVPELSAGPADIPILIQRQYRRYGKLPRLIENPAQTRTRHDTLAYFRTYTNLTVIDPDPYFFNADHTVRYFNGHNVLYCDDNHLNRHGALELEPALEPFFKEMAGP